MNKECIRITADKNEKPYMYFSQEGFWNVDAISQYPKATGYIVQEVYISNSTGIEVIDEKVHYFETWYVNKGVVDDFEEDNPDDSFRCGLEYMEADLLKASLGCVGEVIYDTKVYWIDEKDRLFSQVDGWKSRTVKYAAKLKSTWGENFDDIKKYIPRATRNFVHKVNFAEECIIKQSVVKLYEEKIKNKDEYVIVDLEDILLGSKYEHLIVDICKENDIPLY